MITAAIVTYKNNFEILKKAIDSFLNTNLEVKLYIIDNSPTDKIRSICNDLRIEYIFNNKNIGFGAGHNIIMNNYDKLGEYHLVLNPDIYFENGVIESLKEFMDNNNEIGLIIPKVLYPNGELQYLCKLLPSPIEWIGRYFIPFKSIKNKINYNFEMKFTNYENIVEVPFISGCFMFMPQKVIRKIGVFDEKIFMYCEDTDLSRRIHDKYKTIYYPNVTIYHDFAKGSHKSLRLFWIHVKSAIYYFNKWGWFFDKDRTKINNRIKSMLCQKS